MSKKIRRVEKPKKAKPEAEAAKVADGGVGAGHAPSLFSSPPAGHSHPPPFCKRVKTRAIAHNDDAGTMVALRAARPRCAAVDCIAQVDGETPFCPDCQILVPATLRRALTAISDSRDDQLLRLQAARAIAVKRGQPTLFFDGRIRAIEFGRRA